MSTRLVLLVMLGCRDTRAAGSDEADAAHESAGTLADGALHRRRRRLGRTAAVRHLWIRLQRVVFVRRPMDCLHVRARRLRSGRHLSCPSGRLGARTIDRRSRISTIRRPSLPTATQVAFVSTRGSHTANIWILDLKTRKARNLTGGRISRAGSSNLTGSFRPLVARRQVDRVLVGSALSIQAPPSSRRPAGSTCRS